MDILSNLEIKEEQFREYNKRKARELDLKTTQEELNLKEIKEGDSVLLEMNFANEVFLAKFKCLQIEETVSIEEYHTDDCRYSVVEPTFTFYFQGKEFKIITRDITSIDKLSLEAIAKKLFSKKPSCVYSENLRTSRKK